MNVQLIARKNGPGQISFRWTIDAIIVLRVSAFGCPFCAKLGKTLSDFAAEADVVVYAESLANKSKPSSWRILSVIKSHPALAGKSSLEFNRASDDKSTADRRIIFARISGGAFK